MRLASLARRTVAVTAATALLTSGGVASGLLVGTALAAAPVVASASPAATANTGTPSIAVFGSGFNPATNLVYLVPRFTGAEVDRIAMAIDPVATGPSTTRLVVNPDPLFAVSFDNYSPGPYDIQVYENSSELTAPGQCGTTCFTLTQASQPSVTGTIKDPSTNTACGDGKLILNGTGFAIGGQVDFYLPDGTVDSAMSFSPANCASGSGYPSTTQIKGTYVAGVGAVPGPHFVKVTNTDGQRGSAAEFWQPRVDAISPGRVGRGASTTFTVTGAGFRQGSKLAVTQNGNTTDVTIGASTVSADGTTITAPVSVASDASLTVVRNVIVRSPDGGFHSKGGLLTLAERPTLSCLVGSGSTCPTAAAALPVGRNASALPATAIGTGFAQGMTLSFGGGGLTGTVQSVSPDGTSAAVQLFATPDAVLGNRSVTVTNADFGSFTKGAATGSGVYPVVVNAAPIATDVSPASSARSVTKNVIVTGSGFSTSGMTALFSGSGITVNGTPSVTKGQNGAPDTLALNISTSSVATSGPHDIVLTNVVDGGNSTCVACFGVDSLTITPSGAANAGPRSITFTTDGVTSDAIARLTKFGTGAGVQPDILATGFVAAADNKSGTGTFDLTSAAPGKYSASIFTGGVTYSCTGCFSVTGSSPTVTSMTPNKGGQGSVNLPVSIKGTNFSHAQTVTIGTATVTDVTLVSPTEITARVSIPTGATTGAYDVVVTNSDGIGSGTRTGAFTFVGGPKPTTVAPAALGQGARSQTLTVTGPGFVTGSTADLGSGVTILTTTATDNPTAGVDDTIVVTVDVAVDALLGTHDVVVSNPDGGRGTIVKGLTVNAGPKPTSISPAFFKPGETADVTITGSDFDAAPLPAIADVEFADVAVDESGNITATATVAAGAAAGLRDLTVTNSGDNGFGRCVQCFTIATVPGAPTNVTVTQGNGSAVVSWTAPTNNGGSPLTGFTVDAGQGLSKVSVGADQASATVTGLQAGTTYTFKVVAQNALGDSAPATAQSTAVGAPSAPTSVTGRSGEGRVVVSFSGATPNGSPITSYTIRTAGSGINDVVVAAPAGSGTVTGLTNGTAYSFRVAATNASGTSAFSTATATVVPKFATSLTSVPSPARITAGTRATVAGVLRRTGTRAAIPGATILLTFTPEIGASVSRTTTTSASGTWSYPFAPQYNTTVRARYAGSADQAAVNAVGFKEAVAPRITRSSPASGSVSSSSTTLTIRGGITPNKATRTVGLYQVVNGTLRLVGKATVAGNGSFAINVRLPRGNYRLQIGIGATRGNVAGYSVPFTVGRS